MAKLYLMESRRENPCSHQRAREREREKQTEIQINYVQAIKHSSGGHMGLSVSRRTAC